MKRLPFLLGSLVLLAGLRSDHACGQSLVVELSLGGRRVEGTPLAWSKTDVFLLARDGYLWNFHPSEAADYRRVGEHFTSLSAMDMRGSLRAEFGRTFDVSATGHYLVVHSKGSRDTWAPRFEGMYRNYLRYFTARGFEPKKAQFPLVAVVFPSEHEFQTYARQHGAQLLRGTLGFYSPISNRIALYDLTDSQPGSSSAQINTETIMHEAVHQMAFNTGLHSRYNIPPLWVAEGLGTMFEARGIWEPSQFHQQADRINAYRCEAFKEFAAARRQPGSLPEFLSSDRLFQQDPEGAYGQAWALTFYLFETQPRRYVEYLQSIAARPAFRECPAPERLAEFTKCFGTDLRQLENRLLKFMSGLK